MKVKIVYSYNGSKFLGSQTQPHGKSVEDKIKFAMSKIGINGSILSSSRTDKNVHAINQASTIICPDFWNVLELKNRLNYHLAPYIFIKYAQLVTDKFQVRFDAKFRSYAYIINTGKFNPLYSDLCSYYEDLDVNRLNNILKVFLGKHDFKNFIKLHGGSKTTVRTITQSFAYSYKGLIIIKLKANGFLRTQVRLIVANTIESIKIAKDIRRYYQCFIDKNLQIDFFKFLEEIKYSKLKLVKNIYQNRNFNIDKIEIDMLKMALVDESCVITRIPAQPNGLYLHRVFY